ncbi:MAG: insulinase family protein [Thermodesulfovibrionales bacterium]|nr:insulinase family protein [Thermodesulfovibrionales bacterium]
MYIKAELENGIPVVMEQLTSFRSVILGIWVKVGSRNESREKNGISHFIEHMFFKGTKKRNAKDIAIEIDSIGGELNAFTSRENTVFYVKVLDEFIDKGIELLSDIFLHSTLPEEEIEKEKSVIKEEIKLTQDTPDDYIHDLFLKTIWGDEGLGQSVLGRKETIKNLTRDDLIHHIRKYYGISDTIIACAGNFDPNHIVSLLNENLGSLRRGSQPDSYPTPDFNGNISIYSKDLSEVHICLGVEGLPFSSPDRYALALANSILGGSVSSRLFQEIREKKGYAYSIYSFANSYYDTGFWAIYAGVARKKAKAVTHLIINEFKNLHNTITTEDIRRAKDQLKGSVVLGMESPSSRMQSIARQEIYFKRNFTIKEILQSIEEVTLKQTKELLNRLTNSGKIGLTVMGPVKEEDFLDIASP